ncbi:shikimate dehydrogenase [Mesobacterium pallidum]|uniref:shikimate dehydrogenase n=1 Tax=Mesobacterium pallidum TaxID=2872037 RepID=UPI001EE3A004|nr:shikimate dehydrogenase [Mesobacterium pallidum]
MTQIESATLRHDGARAVRVGLIGHGIGLSRTPGMHMAEGRALGLDYQYDLFDLEHEPGADLAALLDRVEAEGYAGVNVTHPFKQVVAQHLHELSDAARAVNAVNTVVFRDGKRFGHNTDYWGFATAFRQGLPGADKARVLQLGAGGAGGAVANALLDDGVQRIEIFDVNRASAERLAGDLAARLGADRVGVAESVEAARAATGIVNATPIGMAAHPGTPLPEDLLHAGLWVADIIYFPLETAFLAAARARGCRALDGSGMAVYQAVRAFELFSGLAPDPTRMRATFDALDPTTHQGRKPHA